VPGGLPGAAGVIVIDEAVAVVVDVIADLVGAGVDGGVGVVAVVAAIGVAIGQVAAGAYLKLGASAEAFAVVVDETGQFQPPGGWRSAPARFKCSKGHRPATYP
jgi:hypothetical protein